jgi:hypothetical protein
MHHQITIDQNLQLETCYVMLSKGFFKSLNLLSQVKIYLKFEWQRSNKSNWNYVVFSLS